MLGDAQTKPLRMRTEALLRGHAATIRNFRSPNMPWSGDQCKSVASGLSGMAYALPALVCPYDSWEPLLWLVTATLSCMADYIHIGHDSIFHGIDRCHATLVLLRCLLLGAVHLEPLTAIVLTAVPIFCFVKGRDAKLLPTPSSWMFWHCWWHITGGLLITWGTYQVHHGTSVPTVLSVVAG